MSLLSLNAGIENALSPRMEDGLMTGKIRENFHALPFYTAFSAALEPNNL